MRYAVWIISQDDSSHADLKVFESLTQADRWFHHAWMLMYQVPGDSIDAKVIHRLEKELKIDSIERVELHECSDGDAREVKKQVQAGQSKLLKWRDIDHPWGEILEELKRELSVEGDST